MTKQERSASANDFVDAAWYLASYPDVATAGQDPQRHYRLHGKAEGRLSYPSEAKQLSVRMWCGFADVAGPMQRDLAASDELLEAAHAAWQLAVWHTSQPDADFPEQVFEQLLSAWQAGHLPNLAAGLLCIQGLLHHGRVQQAAQMLQRLLGRHGQVPDLCLIAANVSQAMDQPESSFGVLSWVNRIFTALGLAPLQRASPSLPATLGNLACRTPSAAYLAPQLSVIMPVFNSSTAMVYAMESVLAQTWRNLQLIVVDDCSTDDTFDRVCQIAARDQRVLPVRLDTNQGAYAARNAGLRQATGQFITTHDSDDWSHPQKYELLVKTLLGKPELAGAMCHWVRCTENLYFKRWRMEDGLIHASVSTLMFRREVVQQLGRWDETRVAADTEYYERMLAAFGAESVAQILPQVPLVFARDEPGSLTNAIDTHRRTEYFGLRKEYLAMVRAWHRRAKSSADLHLPLGTSERPFPAPSPILRRVDEDPCFDLVLVADLGPNPGTFQPTHALVLKALQQGKRLGLFHWPDYAAQPLADAAPAWYDMALHKPITLLVPHQEIQTKMLAFLNPNILRFRIDAMPKVQFDSCLTLTLDEAPAKLLGEDIVMPVANVPESPVPPTQEDMQHLLRSGLFDAAWYLAMYPDVRRAGIDPLQHYISHGAQEGREPGPYFNTPHYLMTSPGAARSGMLPLLHYLQFGFHAGHSASHPVLAGQRRLLADRPTILFCGHAAGPQLFGAERSALDVLAGFAALQYNAVVCVPPSQNAEYLSALQALACQVMTAPCPPWVADAEPFSGTVVQFEEAIQRFSISAVHVNTIMLREPLVAARRAGIPAVVHVRESLRHDAQTCAAIGMAAEDIQAVVLHNADHIVANSAFTAQGFAKPGATHVVHNTVDLQMLDLPNPIAGTVKVGLISSNQPKKGLEDFLEVARCLHNWAADVELLLIGPDNEHVAELRKQEGQGLLSPNIRFAGYAQSPVMALRQVNIVVNLSHFEESFGRTVLEAMAARRPVVAYQWGAIPELIEHGFNGFLTSYRDAKAVAAHILWLIRNTEALVQMGEAGRRIAQERYGQEKMAGQLHAAYTKILQVATENRPASPV